MNNHTCFVCKEEIDTKNVKTCAHHIDTIGIDIRCGNCGHLMNALYDTPTGGCRGTKASPITCTKCGAVYHDSGKGCYHRKID